MSDHHLTPFSNTPILSLLPPYLSLPTHHHIHHLSIHQVSFRSKQSSPLQDKLCYTLSLILSTHACMQCKQIEEEKANHHHHQQQQHKTTKNIYILASRNSPPNEMFFCLTMAVSIARWCEINRQVVITVTNEYWVLETLLKW